MNKRKKKTTSARLAFRLRCHLSDTLREKCWHRFLSLLPKRIPLSARGIPRGRRTSHLRRTRNNWYWCEKMQIIHWTEMTRRLFVAASRWPRTPSSHEHIKHDLNGVQWRRLPNPLSHRRRFAPYAGCAAENLHSRHKGVYRFFRSSSGVDEAHVEKPHHHIMGIITLLSGVMSSGLNTSYSSTH